MPVVSDASPLILLAKVGRLNLLREIYSEILIPPQVEREIVRRKNESSLITLAVKDGWIKVEEVEISSEVKMVEEGLGLHKGEKYALSLALHTNTADFLADDKLARIAARILGLKAVGCLGIVRRAYEIGIITKNEAVESIQKLVKAGLWISPEVLGEVLTSME
jgi:Predicted nucleic acid-binding protein, contains PIN domain